LPGAPAFGTLAAPAFGALPGAPAFGTLKNNAELIVKICASEISTITVGENGVIPIKQLRVNTITSLDLSSKGLGVHGALILAALIKDNTSVQHLDISSNNLGVDGGKAIAASIAENSTITWVSYQQNAFLSTFLTCLSTPSPSLTLLSLFPWGT
jgi:hypothetical protein